MHEQMITTFVEFMNRAVGDKRLNSYHISLFTAIMYQSIAAGSQNPVPSTGPQLMQAGKINGKATYYKCIRELNNWGYIKYKPSNHPQEGSTIELLPVETAPNAKKAAYNPIDQMPNFKRELVQEVNRFGKRTSPIRSMYNNNILNNNTLDNMNNGKDNMNNSKSVGTGSADEPVQPAETGVKITKSGRNRKAAPGTVTGTPPNLPLITEWFLAQKLPAVEAEKFFNYYTANGWKVGKNPMKNWQAAARNWILKMSQFSNTPGSLHATPNKDYSEPL